MDGSYDLELLRVKVESWGLSFLLEADYLQIDTRCHFVISVLNPGGLTDADR
jgi:hypothetical protein